MLNTDLGGVKLVFTTATGVERGVATLDGRMAGFRERIDGIRGVVEGLVVERGVVDREIGEGVERLVSMMDDGYGDDWDGRVDGFMDEVKMCVDDAVRGWEAVEVEGRDRMVRLRDGVGRMLKMGEVDDDEGEEDD